MAAIGGTAIALVLPFQYTAMASNLQWAHITAIRGQSYVYRYEPRRQELRDYLLLRDSISTAASSLAELRFNDGSLVRLAGSSVFSFQPNTRDFRLWRGLSLLVLPQGTVSRIRTNNVVTGTQGTVLAVKYQELNEISTVVMIASSAVVSLPGNRDVLLQAGQALIHVGSTDSVEVFSIDLTYLVENSAIAEGGFLDVAEVAESVAAQQAGNIPPLPIINGNSAPVELPGSSLPSLGIPESSGALDAEETPVLPQNPQPIPPVDPIPPVRGNNGIGTGPRAP